MNGSLFGKKAVITGGTHGIGYAIAEHLAACGAELALVSRTQQDLDAVQGKLSGDGATIATFCADISNETDVAAMAASVIDRYGWVDVLINNAGIQGPAGTLWETDSAAWRSTFEVNVFGTYLVSKAFLPSMINRRRGKIINVASGAGRSPMPNFSAYAVSKAAQIHLTAVLAEEVKKYGICVNAVGVWAVTRLWHEVAEAGASGGSSTANVKGLLERGVTPIPQENVPLIEFLASDSADHVTGQYVEANSLSSVLATER